MDSFIIFAAQQNRDNSGSKYSHFVQQSSTADSDLRIPWTQYSPSNIRVVPFPTREYTDDEFQSIVKKVMGVLYVSLNFPYSWFLFFYQQCNIQWHLLSI